MIRLSRQQLRVVVPAAILGLLLAGLVGFLVTRPGRGGAAIRPSPSAGASSSPSVSPASSPTPTREAAASPSPAPPPPGCGAAPAGGSPGVHLTVTGGGAADYVTALAWSPDARLFYLDRRGLVGVYEGGGTHVFADISGDVSTAGERGLLGLALSPNFFNDHFVYAIYSRADLTHQRVVRWTDCGGTGKNLTVIVDNLPAAPPGNPSDCCHKGGRLAFGHDGKLYVTLGENHVAGEAQNASSLRGKILRYNADGSVPGDNPFGNPVWAVGLRNPFGIAFGADGTLFVTNNGPSGDAGSPSTGYDMVDIVTRAGNYQWAVCYGYGHPITSGTSCPAGSTEPAWSSENSTVVPTGATWVDAAGPSGYANHFVFCTFDTGMLIYQGPHQVTHGPTNCRLDVKEGPDHALYYSDQSSIYGLS